MNALIRIDHEAPVLTLEQIEVHLSYMRPDLEAANAALPVLRDKLDALSEKVDSKFDAANRDRITGDEMLADKIEQANKGRAAGDEMLAAKIDQANRDRIAGDEMLAEKIERANRERAAGDEALGAKIDQASTKVDAKIDATNARIDVTNQSVAKLEKAVTGIHSKLNAPLLLAGGLTTAFGFFVSVGKLLDWF
jgi:hypothetical protein